MPLKLKADPTFRASIKIPVPGGESEPVDFIFRHQTRKELDIWRTSIDGKTNNEVIASIVQGWNLDDKFDSENLERLIDNYHGASSAIVDGYLAELLKARLGN